ncbi:hypothetical protein OsI_25610 [Oryza sativa Indica Group]|uniref:Uncharacterized protein n=1 Tax=Oryza sativa subsp. indica TaxID=39946 RepID=B8B504_ORYSI|nr:hypothetical protein OsI_25610 [Oryza sativa Indica Group]
MGWAGSWLACTFRVPEYPSILSKWQPLAAEAPAAAIGGSVAVGGMVGQLELLRVGIKNGGMVISDRVDGGASGVKTECESEAESDNEDEKAKAMVRAMLRTNKGVKTEDDSETESDNDDEKPKAMAMAKAIVILRPNRGI